MVEAHEGVGESVVVDAQLVKDGGIEVADRNLVFDDVVGVIIGFSVSDTAFDSASGHPGGKALWVVVAAILVAFQFTLSVSGATKFSGEDNQRFVEHSTLLEVLDKTRASLVDIVGLTTNLFREPDMVVPAAVEELDKANAAFGHPSGEEAVPGEGARFLHFGSVEFFILCLVLPGKIGELGNGCLHTEGHFLLGDGCLNFWVADLCDVLFVEFGDKVEHLVPGLSRDSRWVGEEENGVAGGLERSALVFGGEESGAPESGIKALDVSGSPGPKSGVEHDEVGKVFIEPPKAIRKPGTHGGFAGNLGAGAEEGFAGIVVDRGRRGGLDESEVVGHRPEMGEDFRQPHSIGTMLIEFEHGGSHELGFALGHGGDTLSLVNGFGEFLLEAFVEVGLVVKEIKLGGGAAHKEKNDALGRSFRKAVAMGAGASLSSEISKDGGTKAHAGGIEKLAAGLWVEHGK